jgi:hypothetical protein
MAATLASLTASNVSTEFVMYTVPVGKTSMLLGMNLCNNTGSELPATVRIKRGAVYINLVKDFRIAGGKNDSPLKGKNIMMAGDELRVSCAATSMDCIASVAEGI